MPRWIQDPKTGKLVPQDQYHGTEPNRLYVLGDIQPFVSPIDGTLISSRSKLRDHNNRHGVTNSSDYSPEFLAKRKKARDDEITGNTKKAQQERRQLIDETLRRNGI